MAISDETIRFRAYQIWENEGKPEGRAQEHWKQASRELAGDNSEGGADQEDNMQGSATASPLGPTGHDAPPTENESEVDVLNRPETDGSVSPVRRGRTSP